MPGPEVSRRGPDAEARLRCGFGAAPSSASVAPIRAASTRAGVVPKPAMPGIPGNPASRAAPRRIPGRKGPVAMGGSGAGDRGQTAGPVGRRRVDDPVSIRPGKTIEPEGHPSPVGAGWGGRTRARRSRNPFRESSGSLISIVCRSVRENRRRPGGLSAPVGRAALHPRAVSGRPGGLPPQLRARRPSSARSGGGLARRAERRRTAS